MNRIQDEERIHRIRQGLKKGGLDAIVCSLPANVLLLTGYWPVVGTSVAIATRDGQVAVVAPEDELELAERGWGRVHGFSPGSLKKITAVVDQVREPLKKVAHELGIERGRIAYEGAMSEPASYAGMMIYGAALPHLLTEILPNGKQVAADETLLALRSVKTPRELDCIRKSCAIAAGAFEQASTQLRPGMKETEVASLFQRLHTEIGTDHAHRAGGFVFCMSGPNAAQAYAAYARSRTRPMKHGDLVLVHCNSFADGYWTDITRTYSLGHTDGRARELRGAVLAARSAALNAIGSGVQAREVDAAARRELERRGYGDAFKHSTGHGVGFGAIDHNARPRLHPASPDVLEAGMVFNVEPAIYIEGYGGLRHCDMAAITDAGVEVLTPFQLDEVRNAA